jgi:hypothetical protein
MVCEDLWANESRNIWCHFYFIPVGTISGTLSSAYNLFSRWFLAWLILRLVTSSSLTSTLNWVHSVISQRLEVFRTTVLRTLNSLAEAVNSVTQHRSISIQNHGICGLVPKYLFSLWMQGIPPQGYDALKLFHVSYCCLVVSLDE